MDFNIGYLYWNKIEIKYLCFIIYFNFIFSAAFWCAAHGKGSVQVITCESEALEINHTKEDSTVKIEEKEVHYVPNESEREKEKKNIIVEKDKKHISSTIDKNHKMLCSQPKCKKVIKFGCALNACKGCCLTIHR